MADIESATETYPHFATLAIHAGQDPDQWKSKAVVPPISLSTTFKQDTPGQPVSKRERERRLFYSIYDSIVQYIMCVKRVCVYLSKWFVVWRAIICLSRPFPWFLLV